MNRHFYGLNKARKITWIQNADHAESGLLSHFSHVTGETFVSKNKKNKLCLIKILHLICENFVTNDHLPKEVPYGRF